MAKKQKKMRGVGETISNYQRLLAGNRQKHTGRGGLDGSQKELHDEESEQMGQTTKREKWYGVTRLITAGCEESTATGHLSNNNSKKKKGKERKEKRGCSRADATQIKD